MNRQEELEQIINEMNVSGDVAQYSPPVKFDTVYRNRPCFSISKSEMRKFIKLGLVPERIEKFCNYYKTQEIYIKNNETMITFNYKKFKNGKRG